ncbi:MAG TPA: hypothetical protein VMS74_11455 [Acidimicrobiia bacterium]|nr:hypothetical protein [Acidimicrobiia bacterium]
MSNIRAIFGLFLAVVAVGLFPDASSASDRSGTLMVDKECSGYTGGSGSFCTFTSSNLRVAPAGSKVFYLQPADLASDVILDPPGPGNSKAFGRCELDEETLDGVCTFNGGTGKFTHFQATLTVTYTGDVDWHWEGPYSFHPST